jgi:hypothetical protein
MLTEVTAASTNRDIVQGDRRKEAVECTLLFYRRMKESGIHEAKRTVNGLPTKMALLDRAWVEEFSQKGWPNWKTSFEHCCLMLREDAAEERAKAVKDIDRAWRKALVDWGRKRALRALEEMAQLQAEQNPEWAKRRAIQEDLPLLEGKC